MDGNENGKATVVQGSRADARSAGDGEMSIVTTGEPVPAVAASRGEFANLIQETIGEHWSAGYASFDARTETLPDPRVARAFIITGSAANVPNREDWMLKTEAWLREVLRAGVPM